MCCAIQLAFRVVLFIALIVVRLRCLESQEPSIDDVLISLKRQDAAISDLEFEYECKHFSGHVETGKPVSVLSGRWIKTKENRERIERSRITSGGKRWEEVAVFDGNYHMTRDNQSHGSGQIGTAGGSFLSISESPKVFGLLIQSPFGDLTIASYLSRFRDDLKFTDSGGGTYVIEGPFPTRDPNENLSIRVDKRFGYRPTQIEFFDIDGIYTRFVISDYRTLPVDDLNVWLPDKGYWYGFDPEARTPSSLMSFTASSIKMNTSPSLDNFVLTYPKGALILNTDTGESFYASRDTTIEDAPMFSNAKLSLSDHDKKLVSTTLAEPSTRRFPLMVLFVVLVGLVAWTVIRFRHNHASRN